MKLKKSDKKDSENFKKVPELIKMHTKIFFLPKKMC